MFDQLGERKYLSRNERAAFLDAVLKSPLPAEKAFCLTLFFTGCRISEALRLNVSAIDFEERYLVFRTLKQRSQLVIFFLRSSVSTHDIRKFHGYPL